MNLLIEECFKNYDSCIALGIDELNILISMYSKKIGISKAITKVNRPYFINILGQNNTATIVTPENYSRSNYKNGQAWKYNRTTSITFKTRK